MIAAIGSCRSPQSTAVLILAFAMGLQASAITQFSGVAVSTVVVTSTLAAHRRCRARPTCGPAKRASLPVVAMPRLLALTWLGYLVGAVAGALLLPWCPIRCWCRSSCWCIVMLL